MKSLIVKPRSSSQNTTSFLSVSQQRDGIRMSHMKNNNIISNEELFDFFMEDALVLPLHEAFEPQIRKMFQSEKCILWIDQPKNKCLVSSTFSLVAGYNNSLAGLAFKNKEVMQVSDTSQFPGSINLESKLASTNSPQLFFPIKTHGVTRGVVQIVKRHGAKFTEDDMQTMNMIIRKFDVYGDSLFSSEALTQIALSLYSNNDEETSSLALLKKHFQCQKVELWHFDVSGMNGQLYDTKLHEMAVVQADNYGLVGASVLSQSIINAEYAENHPDYDERFDGLIPGPVLIVTSVTANHDSWSVVLRGKEKQFSTADESQLQALMPFIIRSVSGFSYSEEQTIFKGQLSGLLDTAAFLTSTSKLEKLVKIIKGKAIDLIQCEKCLLYIYDSYEKQLISYQHYKVVDNKKKHRRFPLTKGIAGIIAKHQKIIDVLDPHSDPSFSDEIDTEPDFDPESFLGGPIYDSKNKIIGVLILLNKINNSKFEENDKKLLKAFSAFAGISLENTIFYEQTRKISKHLRKLVDLSHHTNEESILKPFLRKVMRNFLNVLKSRRISFFIFDNYVNKLKLFLQVGEKAEYEDIFSLDVLQKRTMIKYNQFEIRGKLRENNIQYFTSESISKSNEKLNQSNVISKIYDYNKNDPSEITNSNEDEYMNEKTYCFPIFNNENSLLGVLENHINREMNEDDFNLFHLLISMTLMILERIQIKELTFFGYGEIDISDWILDEELCAFETPRLLEIKDDFIFSSDFNSNNLDGIELFKVVFKIFSYFDIMKDFSITNEMLFIFLLEIRATYNKIPYFNWRHAVDTTQFLAFLLYETELHNVLSKNDILALFISSLCHDANHDGFSDDISKNSTSSNFLDALMKKQSVMESHHCSIAISVLSHNGNLIFEMKKEEQKEVFDKIVHLILSTDMSKHFDYVNKMKDLLLKNEFNINENLDHRLLLMQNLLKCADISFIIRPIRIANELIDPVNHNQNPNSLIYEEFFQQCDFSNIDGIVYSSSVKTRENIDRTQSLISILNNICLPLFEVLAQFHEKLKFTVERAQLNIDIWKKEFRDNH